MEVGELRGRICELLTRVFGLAIDQPVEAPTTKTHHKNIQYQVEEE